jgi:hypothetical protein
MAGQIQKNCNLQPQSPFALLAFLCALYMFIYFCGIFLRQMYHNDVMTKNNVETAIK